VSVVPPEIAGIGSTAQKLRVSPGFDPLKSGVGPEEYFVFSRIDGQQTLREIMLATGLPVERSIAIIQKLRSIGAVLLPGEVPPKPVVQPRTVTPVAVTRSPTPQSPHATTTTSAAPPSGRRPAAAMSAPGTQVTSPRRDFDVTLPGATPAERDALAERNDLSDTERRRVLAIARLVDAAPHELLGVSDDADAKTLKHAYFLLSKEIHPDRFYGKQLGTFGQRLSVTFEAVSRAYAKLTSTESPTRASTQRVAEQPQTPLEYAAELFERACTVEVGGDHMGAMKLFAAAVRIDSQVRYLRRATICAIAAGQPRSALEYAKKAQTQAPEDPSAARLLATAFRAAGKLADAEEVLLMAMALKTENDMLSNELRNDLSEVRRLLAQ
jgi:hypothetical protein